MYPYRSVNDQSCTTSNNNLPNVFTNGVGDISIIFHLSVAVLGIHECSVSGGNFEQVYDPDVVPDNQWHRRRGADYMARVQPVVLLRAKIRLYAVLDAVYMPYWYLVFCRSSHPRP